MAGRSLDRDRGEAACFRRGASLAEKGRSRCRRRAGRSLNSGWTFGEGARIGGGGRRCETVELMEDEGRGEVRERGTEMEMGWYVGKPEWRAVAAIVASFSGGGKRMRFDACMNAAAASVLDQDACGTPRHFLSQKF